MLLTRLWLENVGSSEADFGCCRVVTFLNWLSSKTNGIMHPIFYSVFIVGDVLLVREGLTLRSHALCNGSECELLLLWFGSVSCSLCPDVNDHMKCKTEEIWAWNCCWLFFSISSSNYCSSPLLQQKALWCSGSEFSLSQLRLKSLWSLYARLSSPEILHHMRGSDRWHFGNLEVAFCTIAAFFFLSVHLVGVSSPLTNL